jgi:nitrite reductase (NADH) small subunit/3-phenylpropionate/trans-cinnamate dioxygenase ferredoxin subunit
MSWVSLCDLNELREGLGKYVEIDGFQLAVFLSSGQVYAIDNTCPHAGGALCDGEVEAGCVVCPWHQWTFQLENGQLRDSPGVMISTYKTRLFPRESATTLVQADLPKY